MVWQDIVLTIGGFALFALLFPTILDSSSKVPRTTSIPIAGVLVLFTITYVTMSFYLSALASLSQCFGWIFIAWKRADT